MKLWLDENCALDLSRAGVEHVERALRNYLTAEGLEGDTELETAANIIRAHLQHLPREKKR